ncbi:MAG: hypothetical protein ABSA26_18810 [Thermoguttaceae bacterium]
MQIGELKLEDAAQEAAGNWQHFDCFSWHRASELDDPENWAIIYTHHRDSGLIDLSNSEAIAEALKPFLGKDIIAEHHHHWAVGHIDGYSIRVYRRGHITRAFRAYQKLAQRLTDYPILDEEDYSSREYEATIENLADAAWKLKHEFELPEGWEQSVYDWFSEHDCAAIESSDDQGGYPTEDQLRAAFEALFPQIELV